MNGDPSSAKFKLNDFLGFCKDDEASSVASRVKEHIDAVVKRANVAGEICFFGSYTNGFHTMLSDLDSTLITSGFVSRVDSIAILKRIMLTLSEKPFVEYFQDVTTVFEAMVPILKFAIALEKDTGKCDEDTSAIWPATRAPEKQIVEVDLSVNNFLGVRNSKLLHTYCDYENRIARLGIIVKTWAKQRDLVCSADGYLNTYAYMLLILFYLQCGCTPPVAPNLQAIPQPDPHTQSDANGVMWATAFENDLSKIKESSNTQSVDSLLMGFFVFYTRTFKWDAVAVSIRQGSLAVLKDTLQCFGANETAQWCIEDPFDLRRNLASNCTLAAKTRILSAMQGALSDLEANNLTAVLNSPLVFGPKSYYLRCTIYKSVAPEDLFDFFSPFGLRMMYFPQAASNIAFFAFDSIEERRRAHAKNESYIGEMQLQLHYTNENFLADVYHADEYVVYPKEGSRSDEKAETRTLNPETQSFLQCFQDSYIDLGAPYVASDYDMDGGLASFMMHSYTSPSLDTGSYCSMWEPFRCNAEPYVHEQNIGGALATAGMQTTQEGVIPMTSASEDCLLTHDDGDWRMPSICQENDGQASNIDARECENAQLLVMKSELNLLTDIIEISWKEAPMRMLPQMQIIIRTPSVVLSLRLLGVRQVLRLLTTGDASSEARTRAANSFLESGMLPDLLAAACGVVETSSNATLRATKFKHEVVHSDEMAVALFVAEFKRETGFVKPSDECSLEQLRRESSSAVRLLCGGRIDVLVGQLLRAIKKVINETCHATEVCSRVLVELTSSTSSTGCLSTLWELKVPVELIALINSPVLMRPNEESYSALLANCVRVLAHVTVGGTSSDRLKLLELGAGPLFTQLSIIHGTGGRVCVVDDCVRALAAFASRDDTSVRPPACDQSPSYECNSTTFGVMVEILSLYSEHQTIAMNAMITIAGLCRDTQVLVQHLPSVLHGASLVSARQEQARPALVVMAVLLLNTIADKCATWLTEGQMHLVVSGIAEQVKPRAEAETLRIALRTLARLCERNPQVAIPVVLSNKACWRVIDCAEAGSEVVQMEAIRTIWAIIEPRMPESPDKVAFSGLIVSSLSKLIYSDAAAIRDATWHVFLSAMHYLACAQESMDQIIDGSLLNCLVSLIGNYLAVVKGATQYDYALSYFQKEKNQLQVDEKAFLGKAIVVLSMIIEHGTETTVTKMSEHKPVGDILFSILSKPEVYVAVPIALSSQQTLEFFARTVSAALRGVLRLYRVTCSATDDWFANKAFITSVTRLGLHSHESVCNAANDLIDEITAQTEVTDSRCPVPWSIFVDLLYPDITDSSPIQAFRTQVQSCTCALCYPLSTYVSNNPLFVTKSTDDGADAMTASPGALILHPHTRLLAVQALLRIFTTPTLLSSIDKHDENELSTLSRCVSLLAGELEDSVVGVDALRTLAAMTGNGTWREVVLENVSVEAIVPLLRKGADMLGPVVRILRKLIKANSQCLAPAFLRCLPTLGVLLQGCIDRADYEASRELCRLIRVVTSDGNYCDDLRSSIAPLVHAMQVPAAQQDAFNSLCSLVRHSGDISSAVDSGIIQVLLQRIRGIIETSVADTAADVTLQAGMDKVTNVDRLVMVQLLTTLCILLRHSKSGQLPMVESEVAELTRWMEQLQRRAGARIQLLARSVLRYLARVAPKQEACNQLVESQETRSLQSPVLSRSSKSTGSRSVPLDQAKSLPREARAGHSEYLTSAMARLQIRPRSTSKPAAAHDSPASTTTYLTAAKSRAKGKDAVNSYISEAKARVKQTWQHWEPSSRSVATKRENQQPSASTVLRDVKNTYLSAAKLRVKASQFANDASVGAKSRLKSEDVEWQTQQKAIRHSVSHCETLPSESPSARTPLTTCIPNKG